MHVRIIQPFTISGVGVFAPGDKDVEFDAELGGSLIAGGLCLPADAPVALVGQTTVEPSTAPTDPTDPSDDPEQVDSPEQSQPEPPAVEPSTVVSRSLVELGVPAKIAAIFAESGITTEAHAREYLAARGSFNPLAGVGPATSRLVVGLLS